MDSIENKIKKIESFLSTAATSLHSARTLLSEISGSSIGESDKSKFQEIASSLGNAERPGDEGRIVEGVFDGERMIDPEGHTYPIPANYISKSKLIEGDGLKLTIGEDGKFLYKQIKPLPRKHLIGTLTLDDGQYKVIADGVAYKVVLAAVTYFKANIGDRITIVVPDGKEEDVARAAIESVLPSE